MRMSLSNNPGPIGHGKAALAPDDESVGSFRVPMQASAPGAARAAAGAVALSDLHFYVRYSMLEYVSFMWQHGGYLIRRRRIGAMASLYMRIKSTATAALHFVLLGRGKRTYEFTIDAHGIVRSTSDVAGGVTLIGWDDVMAIRSYSCGFMMMLKRGTLPIPFRCLDADGEAAMRVYAAERKGRRSIDHSVH
jgi:hypothetical protein